MSTIKPEELKANKADRKEKEGVIVSLLRLLLLKVMRLRPLLSM